MTGANKAMADRPKRAMVLAAGRGERMRPITDSRPKPLVQVRGRAMIDWALDRLAAAGVEDAVVNLHHLGEQIESHLSTRRSPSITLSPEARLLDTGGGVRQALARLGERPFYVINGDVVWLDGRTPALERLAAAWDEAKMDALLLLHPTAYALGYEGQGDFMMNSMGKLRRRGGREVAPFVFTGAQILHPRLFHGTPEGAFSLNLIYDKALEADRLWGLRHDGEWFHVGTPEALEATQEALHVMNFLAVHR
jgi:MurNAc alpha-1-phosphate uridylyltransferase